MLTDLRPDLPRLENAPAQVGGDVLQRLATIEGRLEAISKDQLRFIEAISNWYDGLNRQGVIKIADAAIDGTPIGATSPSTGKFTTLEVTTSSVFPSAAITPGVSFGGGTTGITYSIQTGSRIYLGGWVIVTGIINLSAKGSSTGDAKITGFPVACRNNNDSFGALTLRLNGVTFTGQYGGHMDLNTTTAFLQQTTEAGVVSNLTDANFSNTSQILFTAIYRAS